METREIYRIMTVRVMVWVRSKFSNEWKDSNDDGRVSDADVACPGWSSTVSCIPMSEFRTAEE
jgi:hypothetical protein